MSLKIVCSGYLLRYPLGGFSFHHLQYLVGFKQLGHEVTYFEDYGWPDSCYDPRGDAMSSDPSYGLTYLSELMRRHGLAKDWCYLAEDGSEFGLSREQLAARIRECDVYFNISNINWIPELEQARRRALIDTDPVFTQIDAHGMHAALDRHHLLFTYGENAGRDGCTMPLAGRTWLPTRQPVVLDLWNANKAEPSAPITTIMNWTVYSGGTEFGGKTYGQKDVEFAPFITLPRDVQLRMLMAIGASTQVEDMLSAGGWEHVNAREVTRDPASYQRFVRSSKAEFSVAKHGYVVTHSGWFSDRSTGYLASGRPVIVQDTGFSRFLPCGRGLVPFRTPDEARAALRSIDDDYEMHCRHARAVVEEHFDSRKVLSDLLEKCV